MNLNFLSPIESQVSEMTTLIESWANINSGSTHVAGIELMQKATTAAFASLEATQSTIPVPTQSGLDKKGNLVDFEVGNIIKLEKRPEAPFRFLCCGHLDTVFPPTSPFQKTRYVTEKDHLHGPGVSDMKGGIVILLKALEAFENSDFKKQVGWTVLLTPDEEIGSIGSKETIIKIAKQHQIGICVEPSLPNGNLISERKGSLTFVIKCTGKSAHAGRHFDDGVNAISGLVQFLNELNRDTTIPQTLNVNLGEIHGGQAANIVPPSAFCRINMRSFNPKDFDLAITKIKSLLSQMNQKNPWQLEFFQETLRNPKPLDHKTKAMFSVLKSCSDALDIQLDWESSGGVSDGNLLAEAGIPCIDNLGAKGGKIHTTDEYLEVNGLVERTKLLALLFATFNETPSL
jgi:glutamate carboxypeptidase